MFRYIFIDKFTDYAVYYLIVWWRQVAQLQTFLTLPTISYSKCTFANLFEMKIVWNAPKTNGSQLPVSCYIMFHKCVGDHFIIHYLIPFHYCICHRCKPTLPLYSFVNQSWRSSQTLKNHVGACTIIIKSFSVFYHNQIRADQKRGRNWNRFLLLIHY